MRNRLVFIPLLLFSLLCHAQNFQRYDLNYEDLGRYNPAAVSEYDRQVSAIAKYTISGSDTYMEDPLDLAFDMITGSGRGRFMLGGIRDSYSFFERYFAYLGYAWKIQLGTGFINVGARVNLSADRVDMTSLGSYDGGKESLAFIGEDWDLGLEYRSRGFHMGFAVQNIMSSSSEWEDVTFLRSPRTFISNVSYDFITSGEGFQFSPFVLCGYSLGAILDFGAYVDIAGSVSLSYAYRMLEDRHVTCGGFRIPRSSFHVRGAYSWSMIHRDSSISAGIIYVL